MPRAGGLGLGLGLGLRRQFKRGEGVGDQVEERADGVRVDVETDEEGGFHFKDSVCDETPT